MSICGLDCCKSCPLFVSCGGCEKCKGHPMGGDCVAASIINRDGIERYKEVKKDLINKINELSIKGLHIDDLNLLMGSFVNLEYQLDNKTTVKFLNDNEVYFGNQIEQLNSNRCYGVVANTSFILVCEYESMGANPKLILYKTI